MDSAEFAAWYEEEGFEESIAPAFRDAARELADLAWHEALRRSLPTFGGSFVSFVSDSGRPTSNRDD